ncbi:MAG TPA: histidinol-phosphate transaminase [Acidobacteriota bacterium]|nr:histidinol-phosphate transaminase [Acidobacteriota bacterium]
MAKIETSAFLERLIRPNIRALEPYHSARETVQTGILLDANENPFLHERDGVVLNRYPDPFQRELRTKLAGWTGVEPDQLLAGNGSDEVIDWIFKVFCEPGLDAVAIPEPTYGMYRVMAHIFGVEVQDFLLTEDFQFDDQHFLTSVRPEVKALFLCSPNNPTGNLLDTDSILRVLQDWNGIVVLDEAYIDFADRPSLVSRVHEFPGLIVLRTFSKAYGRAALRLGFAVANHAVIELFLKVKAPYNLNAVTLREGIRALQHQVRYREEIEKIVSERRRVAAALAQLPGVNRVHASDANFLLFECRRASDVYQRLFEKGIVVRNRSSLPLLSGCIRVSIGTEQENNIFLQELEKELK